MEWVSYLAGERHSNEPYRVSPVLRAFRRTLNEAMEDEPHQRLLPYLERTIRSRAAWAASLGAARAVAWMPQAAGRGAALEVAWSSTGRPAWAAALIGVRKLACDRATAISDEIAGDAAAILIRRARTDTRRAAAGATAEAALRPTIHELQQSALGLLDRMLPSRQLPASLVPQPS